LPQPENPPSSRHSQKKFLERENFSTCFDRFLEIYVKKFFDICSDETPVEKGLTGITVMKCFSDFCMSYCRDSLIMAEVSASRLLGLFKGWLFFFVFCPFMVSRSFKTDPDASTFFACHFQFRLPFPNTDTCFELAFLADSNLRGREGSRVVVWQHSGLMRRRGRDL